MKRIINLGKVAYSGNNPVNEVTIEIEIKDKEGKGKMLSICGKVWNPRHTDILAWGQCYDTILKLFPNSTRVKRIVEIWKKYHLNDMNPACAHQKSWDFGKVLEIPEYTRTQNMWDRKGQAENGTLPKEAYEQYQADTAIVKEILYPGFKARAVDPEEGLIRGLIKIDKYKTQNAGCTTQLEHPEGLLSKPCPVCGYKYGSSWLFEEIPEEILKELETI